MGSTRQKRRRERSPWEVVTIHMRSGALLRVNCPKCGRKQVTLRYWDPDLRRAVCWECVPLPVQKLIPRQADSQPYRRPMALE